MNDAGQNTWTVKGNPVSKETHERLQMLPPGDRNLVTRDLPAAWSDDAHKVPESLDAYLQKRMANLSGQGGGKACTHSGEHDEQ